MTTEVSIHYAHSLDAESWATRHAAGQVPDRWPYGLNHLSQHFPEVDSVRPPTGTSAILARLARKTCGGYQWILPGLSAASDIAIAWDERTGLPVANRLGGTMPVIFGVIWLTEPSRASHWTDRIARQAFRRCSGVWALSSAQVPVVRECWPIDRARVHHLLFGVDDTFWTPSGEPQRGRVVVVGNDRHRDHGTAIRAVQLAKQVLPDVKIHLITRQPLDVPADLGRRSPLLSHPELRAAYETANVCAVALQPNIHCSGITTVLEAMACGRPVVVTDTPGMRDYVTDRLNGLLVPPGDPSAMADAIADVIRDPDLAAGLARAGRAQVEAVFNTTAQAARLAELITSVS